MSLLTVRDLRVDFPSPEGAVRAVRGISFEVGEGETLAVVGESGSGKSAAMLALLGLLPADAAVTGSVTFAGVDLLHAPEGQMQRLRGGRIGMVFADAAAALNPTMTVGRQVAEVARRHLGLGRRAAWAHAVETLGRVGVAEPARRAHDHPHQCSGGLRQRVLLAIALAAGPRLLIADEPTTALDGITRHLVLERIDRLKAELRLAVVLITHDLGIVARAADRVLVMYAGQIVEQGSADDIFYRPGHPYSLGLLRALPRGPRGEARPPLPIPGDPADALDDPSGCAFAPRCPHVLRGCLRQAPGAYAAPGDPGHSARCWLHDPAAPDRIRWGEAHAHVGGR